MEWIVVPVLAVGIAILGLTWRVGRSRQVLNDWATTHGLTIVSSRFCWFRRGPFFLRSTEDQSVFYVTVTDKGGLTRNGWVRCGSFWVGLLSNTADVRWDDSSN